MTEATHPHDDMLPVQALFSYDVLDAETREFASRIADRIRHRNVSMAQAYIDNGKDLLAAKERIPRGMWITWLRDTVHYSVGTATEMMRVARHFGHIQLAESQVATSALELLATSDVSATIRNEAVELIESGSLTSTHDAYDLVRQHNPHVADRMERSDSTVVARRNREIVHELTLQVAEMSFAVRNMQMALSTAYGIPFRGNVADALERLQVTSDLLIQLVPQRDLSRQSRHGLKMPGASSRFLGVSWSAPHQRWVAQIRKDSKKFHLGYYDTEEETARAYDAKARELYGDNARLNFPDEAS